jgi:hypothetical protein
MPTTPPEAAPSEGEDPSELLQTHLTTLSLTFLHLHNSRSWSQILSLPWLSPTFTAALTYRAFLAPKMNLEEHVEAYKSYLAQFPDSKIEMEGVEVSVAIGNGRNEEVAWVGVSTLCTGFEGGVLSVPTCGEFEWRKVEEGWVLEGVAAIRGAI